MLIELTHAEILAALAAHYERRFGVRVDRAASSVGADGRLQLWAKLAAGEPEEGLQRKDDNERVQV